MAAEEGLLSEGEKILYDILVPVEWPEKTLTISVRLRA